MLTNKIRDNYKLAKKGSVAKNFYQSALKDMKEPYKIIGNQSWWHNYYELENDFILGVSGDKFSNELQIYIYHLTDSWRIEQINPQPIKVKDFSEVVRIFNL